jgi:diacylglycerol O-acyltransferase
MKKLSLIDYMFILSESAETPMHVTAVQIFELPKGYRGNFVRDLVNDLLAQREVGPPFNYVLRPAKVGLPSWEEVADIDLDYHIRHSALPKPGSMHDLWQLISRLTSRLLDRSRPLWEVHVIEGLAKRRFAIYVKAHHAFMDGATGVRMGRAALSESPDDTDVPGFWREMETQKPKKRSRKPVSALAAAAGMAQSQLRLIPDLVGFARRRGLEIAGVQEGHLAVPFAAPSTPFNATVRAARRNAGVSVPLSGMKATGKAVGATINEVLLTIVDMAFNRYLLERDALPDKRMVAATPIDLRQKTGQGDKGSNAVATLLVKLGEPDATPADRLRQIHLSSKAAKKEAQGMSPEALMSYSIITGLGAGILEKLHLTDYVPPPINILVSNVKGLDKTHYLKGAKLLHTYPAPPLGQGMAMTIITSSYVDAMDIGMSSDRDAVPELEALAKYIGEAFTELEAAVKAKPGAKANKKRTKASAKAG